MPHPVNMYKFCMSRMSFALLLITLAQHWLLWLFFRFMKDDQPPLVRHIGAKVTLFFYC